MTWTTGGPPRAPLSASDAALAGFRLVRAQPLAFLAWILAAGVFSVALLFVQVEMIGPAITDLMAAVQSGAALPPEQAMAASQRMGPGQGALLLLALLFGAVMNAAVYRAVLRPQEGGFGFFRLGMAELHQGVLILCILVGALALEIAFVIVALVAALVLFALAKLAGASTAVLVGGGVLTAVALLGVAVWLAVRLCLAGAITFAGRRIEIFDSWRLTRGRFWPIFGAYVLAVVILMLASVMFFVLAVFVGAAVGGAMPNAANLRTFAYTLSPLSVAWACASAFLGAFNAATLTGLPAVIYAQIAEAETPPGGDPHAFGYAPLAAPNAPTGEFPITPPRPTP